jgi:serine/threonine protein kinase
MEFVPGTIFANDYRVRHALSSGGMGAVYVVDQISTGKARALKLMHPQLAQSAELRARFEQEAKIGARIPSEHVVEVHAAGIDFGTQQPYIVMELLEGESLAARITRSPVDPSTAREILAQMCHALIAAHRAGVVHRDLKPENVFLAVPHRIGATMTVKILDFGIAKIVEREAVATSAIGSPMWLAPEQTERSPVAPATDVWALGLIAFYMLTGVVFWRNATGPDASIPRLMREVVMDPIPPASQRAAAVGARLPQGFDGWFARCVSRNMNARFPDAAAAWATLEPLLVGPTIPAAGAGARITPGAQQFAETQPFVDVSPTDRERTGDAPKLESGTPVAGVPRRSGFGMLLVGGLLGACVVIGGIAGAFWMISRNGHAKYTTDAGTYEATGTPSGLQVTITPPPSAPSTPPPPATTPPPIPSGVPSFAFPGMPAIGGAAGISGMVIAEKTPELQTDAQAQFNDHIAAELASCLPTERRGGQLTVMVKVKADGTVSQVVPVGTAGPFVNCMVKVLNGSRFVATKRGGDVVFSLFWQK